MKKRTLTAINTLLEISLYIVLLPIMLNLILERSTGIQIPVILMSTILGILIYSPDLIRLKQRKEREKKIKELLAIREEALRQQTLIYLIELFNKEIEERQISLKDYEEAFTIISKATEESEEELKERITQFLLEERKRA